MPQLPSEPIAADGGADHIATERSDGSHFRDSSHRDLGHGENTDHDAQSSSSRQHHANIKSVGGVPLKVPVFTIIVLSIVSLIIEWYLGYEQSTTSIQIGIDRLRSGVVTWAETFTTTTYSQFLTISSLIQGLEIAGISTTNFTQNNNGDSVRFGQMLYETCNLIYPSFSTLFLITPTGLGLSVPCDVKNGLPKSFIVVSNTTYKPQFYDARSGRAVAATVNTRQVMDFRTTVSSYYDAYKEPQARLVLEGRGTMFVAGGGGGNTSSSSMGYAVGIRHPNGNVFIAETDERLMKETIRFPEGTAGDTYLLVDSNRNVVANTKHMSQEIIDKAVDSIFSSAGSEDKTSFDTSDETYYVASSQVEFPSDMMIPIGLSLNIVAVIPSDAIVASSRNYLFGLLIASLAVIVVLVVMLVTLSLLVTKPLEKMHDVVRKTQDDIPVSAPELELLTTCVAIKEIRAFGETLRYVLLLHNLYKAFTPQYIRDTVLPADSEDQEEYEVGEVCTPRARDASFQESVVDSHRERASSPVPPSPAKQKHPGGGLTIRAQYLLTQTSLRKTEATVLVIHSFGIENQYNDTPQRGLRLVTSFVQSVLRVMEKNQGTLAYLNADRIVMTWNASAAHAAHELSGATCALQLVDELQSYEGAYGIGLVQGTIIVGHVGSSNHRNTAIIGYPVSLSDHLPSLARLTNCRIIISDRMNDKLRELYHTQVIDWISDHRFPMGAGVYELQGRKGPTPHDESSASSSERVLRVQYAEAFGALHNHEADKAIVKLTSVLRQSVSHVQAKRLLRLAMYMQKHPEKFEVPYRRETPHWICYEDMSRSLLDDPLEDEDAGQGDLDAGMLQTAHSIVYNTNPTLREQLHEALLGETNRGSDPVLGSRQTTSIGGGGGGGDGNVALSGSNSNTLQPKQSTMIFIPELEGGAFMSNELDEYDSIPVKTIDARKQTPAPIKDIEPEGSFIPSTSFDQLDGIADVDRVDGDQEEEMPTQIALTKGRKYTLCNTSLGKGSYGAVYLGLERSGALVAIKALQIQRHKDVKELELLINEVSLMESLVHENVVQYFGSCVFGKRLFLVMECVIAGSLSTMLERFGKIPFETATRYIKDVLHGLQYLHQQQIVHHDIKPHNVLVMSTGVCKLTDFGASLKLCDYARKETEVMGSPLYMAPEVLKGESDTESGDIWSVGIMFLQLLTGTAPYPVEMTSSPGTFLYRVGAGLLRPTVPTDIPELAQDFANKCLCPVEERASVTDLIVHPLLLQ